MKRQINSIRIAAAADARAIAEMHVATWRAAYRAILPDELLDNCSVDERTTRWDEILLQTENITWVAVENDRIVGFATAGPNRDPGVDSGTGELIGLYVSSEHWGQGIGRSLCRHAFDWLSGAGFRTVKVWTLTANTKARAFYERLGLQLDGAQKRAPCLGHEVEQTRYSMPLGERTDFGERPDFGELGRGA